MNDPYFSEPPVPPVEPEPWQCCGSGCDPCVYDRYWDELARYEVALERWKRVRAGGTAGEAGGSGGDPSI
ncbi:MAG: oxidoreductase [Anaerolinea sp.]|nr:oxidoreductase [Anaerolinea sp.]